MIEKFWQIDQKMSINNCCLFQIYYDEIFLMVSDWNEKYLYILKLYIKSRSNSSHRLSDDVESDGEIRFLICLRISDKILGYILH